MGLNLLKTTATLTNGQTYQPNGLLSSYWSLTLPVGTCTISAPVAVSAGDIIAVRFTVPVTGIVTVTFGPEYQLNGYNTQTHYGGGYSITYGWFCEGGAYQLIWQGAT